MKTRSLLLALFASQVALASCAGLGSGARPSLSTPISAPHSATDSAGAHAAADGFLAAFDSLQFDAFRGYFAEDITMFFPFPQLPARADGRARVEEVFGGFMTAQREGRAAAGRPMVQGIVARDLRIQMAGPDVAVVTFHLGAQDAPSRRSIVFWREQDAWKVLHWHASSAPPQPSNR